MDLSIIQLNPQLFIVVGDSECILIVSIIQLNPQLFIVVGDSECILIVLA